MKNRAAVVTCELRRTGHEFEYHRAFSLPKGAWGCGSIIIIGYTNSGIHIIRMHPWPENMLMNSISFFATYLSRFRNKPTTSSMHPFRNLSILSTNDHLVVKKCMLSCLHIPTISLNPWNLPLPKETAPATAALGSTPISTPTSSVTAPATDIVSVAKTVSAAA